MADPLQMYLADIYTVAPALAGVPALSQCCGFTKGACPSGCKSSDRRGEEAVFRVAGEYQRSQRLAQAIAQGSVMSRRSI